MVFQRFGLFPHKTVLQNVGYGLEIQGKELDERNFSYWDINSKNWKLKEGEYEILIGSSSENIHLKEKLSLK